MYTYKYLVVFFGQVCNKTQQSVCYRIDLLENKFALKKIHWHLELSSTHEKENPEKSEINALKEQKRIEQRRMRY